MPRQAVAALRAAYHLCVASVTPLQLMLSQALRVAMLTTFGSAIRHKEILICAATLQAAHLFSCTNHTSAAHDVIAMAAKAKYM